MDVFAKSWCPQTEHLAKTFRQTGFCAVVQKSEHDGCLWKRLDSDCLVDPQKQPRYGQTMLEHQGQAVDYSAWQMLLQERQEGLLQKQGQ